MDEILTLILTSVITFLVYEGMRTLFDKIKGKRGYKNGGAYKRHWSHSGNDEADI